MKLTMAWVRRRANALSVLGALVIFFSWTITNALTERYSQLRQQVGGAELRHRNAAELIELGGSIDRLSLALQLMARPKESDSQSRHPSFALMALIRWEMERTRMLEFQVRGILEVAYQAQMFSPVLPANHAGIKGAKSAFDEALKMRTELEELWQQYQRKNLSPSATVEQLASVANPYQTYFREAVQPRIQPLGKQLADAANMVVADAQREATIAGERADQWKKVSLGFYVIGSLLALLGQYVDKIDKPRYRETRDSF